MHYHLSCPSWLKLSSADRKAVETMLASVKNSIGYQKGRRSTKHSLIREGPDSFTWILDRAGDQHRVAVRLISL